MERVGSAGTAVLPLPLQTFCPLPLTEPLPPLFLLAVYCCHCATEYCLLPGTGLPFIPEFDP